MALEIYSLAFLIISLVISFVYLFLKSDQSSLILGFLTVPQLLLFGIWWLSTRKTYQWKGKIVVITGGSSGIGRELSLELAQKGAIVVIWDIRKKQTQSTVEEIKKKGGEAHWFLCDVSKKEMVYESADKLSKMIGSPHIVIGNAGIVIGKPFLQTEDEEVQRTIDINLMANFWLAKAFLPAMLESNSGHFVLVSSVAGMLAMNSVTEYCASKFGVFGLAEALRIECLHSKVKVTTICPWITRTGMFDGIRELFLPSLEPHDVATGIVLAIERGESVVVLPALLHPLVYLSRLVPSEWTDWISMLVGATDSVKEFKGRGKKWNTKTIDHVQVDSS